MPAIIFVAAALAAPAPRRFPIIDWPTVQELIFASSLRVTLPVLGMMTSLQGSTLSSAVIEESTIGLAPPSVSTEYPENENVRLSMVVGSILPPVNAFTTPACRLGAFQVCGRQLRKMMLYFCPPKSPESPANDRSDLIDAGIMSGALDWFGTSTVIATEVGPSLFALANHSVMCALVPGTHGRLKDTSP